MEEKKELLETLLDQLTSKESRQKFFETAIGNQRLDYESVPEKYIDDVLEIVPTNAMVSTSGNAFKEDPKKGIQLKFMAELAEHSERYEKAAHLYKEMGNDKKAINCAAQAGLRDLAQEWTEEYIQTAYDGKSRWYSDSPNPQAEFSASRARDLGLEQRAQKIVLDCLKPYADKAFEEDSNATPEFYKKLAKMAKSFDLQAYAEKFYRKAMQIHEENGDYFRALYVAEDNLKDYDKCRLYEGLIETSGTRKERANLSEHMSGREFISGD